MLACPYTYGQADLPEDVEGAHRKGVSGYRISAVRFLSSSSTLPLIVILRIVLEPIQAMMHGVLAAASSECEREEMSKAARGRPRKTAMGLCCESAHEKKAFAALTVLFEDASSWSMLPPCFRTVAIRAHLLQLLASIGCCLHLYLFDIHKGYPFKTFSWLQEPGGMGSAFRAESCHHLFDRWTRSWATWWQDHGGLDSPAAQADLMSVRSLCFVDNAAIEARHASIRREIVALGTQTHPESFLDVSSRFVLRGVRQRDALDVRFGRPVQEAAPEGVGGRPGGDQRNAVEEGAPPRKRLRGGGGAYRAFLSEWSRGDARGINVPGVKAAYAALSDEQRIEYARKGAQGTRAHRAGGRAFGPTATDVDRGLAASRRRHGAEELRAQVMRELRDGQAQRQQAVPTEGRSWEEGLKGICSHVRRERQLASIRDVVHGEVLEQYGQRTRDGDHEAELAPERGPETGFEECSEVPPAQLRDDLAVDIRHFRAPFTRVLPAIAKAVNLKGNSRLGRVFGPAVQGMWESLHTQTCASEVAPFTSGESATPDSPCRRAGFCLCDESGRQTHRMKTKFSTSLGRCFPAGTSTRGHLIRSEVFVLFSGSAVDTDASGCDSPAIVEQRWAYIGHQQLNPMLSYMLDATHAGLVPDEAAARPIQVEISWNFRNSWRYLHDFDKSKRWSMRFWRLKRSSRQLAELRPSLAEVVEMSCGYELGECVDFWRGPPDQRNAVQQRRPRRRPDDDHGASDEDDSAGDDDHSAGDDGHGAGDEESVLEADSASSDSDGGVSDESSDSDESSGSGVSAAASDCYESVDSAELFGDAVFDDDDAGEGHHDEAGICMILFVVVAPLDRISRMVLVTESHANGFKETHGLILKINNNGTCMQQRGTSSGLQAMPMSHQFHARGDYTKLSERIANDHAPRDFQTIKHNSMQQGVSYVTPIPCTNSIRT